MLKKLMKQSGQYLMGNIAAYLAGFISLPILTRLLSVDSFGLLSLIISTLFILVAISKYGLQHAGVRFYEEYRKDESRLPEFYSTLFWGSLTLAVLTSGLLAILWEIAARFDQSLYRGWLVWIIAGLVVMDIMIIRITNFMQIEQRVNHYNLIIIIKRYGNLFLGIPFLIFVSQTADWFLFGMLLSAVSAFLIGTFLFVARERIAPRHFSGKFLRESLRFGVPLQFMEISNLLIKFSDRYLLQFMIGLSAVGIYALGNSLSMYVMEMLFMPVTYAVFPLLMKTYHQKGLAEAEGFISTVANYLVLLAIPIVVGFSVIREDVVVTLASEKFLDSSTIIPLMVSGTILWGFCQLFGAGLHVAKQTGTFAKVVFAGALINIFLNLLLIPKYSYFGAALTTLITYSILLVLIARVSFKHLRIRIQLRKIIYALLCAGAMVPFILMVHIEPLLLQLAVKIAVGAVIYFSCLLLIDTESRQLARVGFSQLHRLCRTEV